MFGHLSKALEWRWIPLCNPGSTSKIQPEACVNIRDLQLFLQLVEKVPHQGDDGISVTKGTSNPAWYFWLASLPLLRLLWCLHVHKVSVMRHEIIRVTSFQELASQPVANHHAVSKGSCSDRLTIMTDAPVDDGDAVICDMQRQSSQSLVLACSNPLAVTWCSNPSRSPQTVVCLYFSCLLVCRVCYTSRTAAHRPDLHPQLGSIWVRRRSLASDK